LNPRPLGYEPTDVRLRCLGQSLVTALTSADRRLDVVPGSLYLSRLSLSRCVRFTNRFTEPVLNLRLSALPRTRSPARLLSSGTQRAREHLIRRSRRIVQGRPLPSVCWADIPELYVRVRRCPAAWQQYWQQSLRPRYRSRPSVFRPDIAPVRMDRTSVMRCRRSLLVADGRYCCCHRCCQPG
jgi:hypothetical protein